MTESQSRPSIHQDAGLGRRTVLRGMGAAAVASALATSVASRASAVGEWGGYSNGQIPLSALVRIPGTTGQYLRADAQAAFVQMSEAYRARFGDPITVTDAYRDYATQVRLKREKPILAATPGTSNHGWALAVDLGGGIDRTGTATHNWMRTYAATYQWILPAWAQPGGMKPEPWHWEYIGSGGAASPGPDPDTQPVEEDDMAVILDVPGMGLWLDTGEGELAGIGSTVTADAFTTNGFKRVPMPADDFRRLRAARAGRELIRHPSRGYAVGTPGGRYRGLGDLAEVQFHQNAGATERQVSEQTFINLTQA